MPDNNSRTQGVTLIECLLAMIVLAVGLVGILALFPVALEQSKGSMEQTHATIVSESVKSAITVALKNGMYDPAIDRWKASIAHDLSDGVTLVRLDFLLPKIGEGWRRFPGDLPIATTDPRFEDPSQAAAFAMSKDPWIQGHVNRVRDAADPSDPYAQFSFAFDVIKLNTLEYVNNPIPSDRERQTSLWKFRVHVFRSRAQTAPTGETILVSGEVPKELVTTFTFQVSAR